MKKCNVVRRPWRLLILLAAACCLLGATAFADPLIVRVQPSGDSFAKAYVITGEARTYFGMVEGGVPPYQYKWEFTGGIGDTSLADVGDPRYIGYDGKVYDTAGTAFARLTVQDSSDTPQTQSATINLQVIAAASDNLTRQKNSAIDRGLRYLYQQEQIGPAIYGEIGSWWPGSGQPIASTGMALIAMENHGHNLQSPDTDIYKKSVQEGVRYLLNNAYTVSLSSQRCIGDPDSNHNGVGVSFSGGYMYAEGIAGMAITNSCDKITAQNTLAQTSQGDVNGKSLRDIIVDATDYLAWAQSEGGGGGEGGVVYHSATGNDGYSLMNWSTSSDTLNIYQGYIYTYIPDGSAVACGGTYTVNWGDGTTSNFSSETYYCPYYPTFGWLGPGGASHTYTTPGTYTATISYSDGVTTLPFISSTPIAITFSGSGTCGLDDAMSGAGGWRYYANYGSSDNSVTQWPALALMEAKKRWNITAVPAVDTMLDYWLAYSQGGDGGFGYDGPNSWENFPKTGAGLIMLNYLGLPADNARVTNALSYLDNGWDGTGMDGNLGGLYGMYAFYKGMKAWGFTTLYGRPWEQLYTEKLVNSQNPWNNMWSDGNGWEDDNFATYSALAILAPEVASLPPVANAGGPYPAVNAGQVTHLNGGASYHQDSAKSIVKWEWDFNAADGLWWETKGAPDPGEGAVGVTAEATHPDTGHDETYTVTLRVTDNSTPLPQTDTDTATINVTSGEVPPVAKTNGPWTGLPGTLITFDGSGSYDPNSCVTSGNPSCLGDSIVKYEWDLNGNGIFNEGPEDGTPVVLGDYSRVAKSFAVPTSLPATLRVTDSYGKVGLSTDALNIISIAIVYGKQYDTCYKVAVDRFRERWGLKIKFRNDGATEASDLKMTLQRLPSNLTISNGRSFSELGDLEAGAEKSTACNPQGKTADIEVLFDRRINPTGDWRWRSEFDYNGDHYAVDNIPAAR